MNMSTIFIRSIHAKGSVAKLFQAYNLLKKAGTGKSGRASIKKTTSVHKRLFRSFQTKERKASEKSIKRRGGLTSHGASITPYTDAGPSLTGTTGR